jgi:hypothetical protein
MSYLHGDTQEVSHKYGSLHNLGGLKFRALRVVFLSCSKGLIYSTQSCPRTPWKLTVFERHLFLPIEIPVSLYVNFCLMKKERR